MQQRLWRAIQIARAMTESIVRLEAGIRPASEDDARAGNPIRLLAVDHVSDDIKRTEGLRPFCASNPLRGETAEERLQRRRRTTEHLRRQIEIEVHSATVTYPIRLALHRAETLIRNLRDRPK